MTAADVVDEEPSDSIEIFKIVNIFSSVTCEFVNKVGLVLLQRALYYCNIFSRKIWVGIIMPPIK